MPPKKPANSATPTPDGRRVSPEPSPTNPPAAKNILALPKPVDLGNKVATHVWLREMRVDFANASAILTLTYGAMQQGEKEGDPPEFVSHGRTVVGAVPQLNAAAVKMAASVLAVG